VERPEALGEKIRYLRGAFADLPNLTASFLSPRDAERQAFFSLGDASAAGAILRMARGESWAQAKKPLAPRLEEILYREKERDADFPWDFVAGGPSRESLYRRYLRAREEAREPGRRA
jgi:hypothetical protein